MLALANQRWNLDFPHVEMASGRGFRVLKVVDDVTRERLAAVLDASILERRVTSERTRPISERGKPRLIVSDNGSELTSNAVLASCEAFVVDWHFIAPG
jgi:transposase InsO family protein